MNPLGALLFAILFILYTTHSTEGTIATIQSSSMLITPSIRAEETQLYKKSTPFSIPISISAQPHINSISTQQIEFTPQFDNSDEQEGEEKEKKAEEQAEKKGNLTLVLIILAAIFAILIIILIIVIVTEAHSVVAAWVAAKREKEHVPTSSERFESELSSASGWHKMEPGERASII